MNKEKSRFNLENRKKQLTKKVQNQPDTADKIMEENRKRWIKYPRIQLAEDADEEIERLMGMMRSLINNYWPAITAIFKNNNQSNTRSLINEFYHLLLTKFDYKGKVPLAQNYIDSLRHVPKDYKRIDYKHRTLLTETAFLLNDIYSNFNEIIKNEKIPTPNEKMVESNVIDNIWYKKNFLNLKNNEGFKKVYDYLENVIIDFRIKDIKRK